MISSNKIETRVKIIENPFLLAFRSHERLVIVHDMIKVHPFKERVRLQPRKTPQESRPQAFRRVLLQQRCHQVLGVGIHAVRETYLSPQNARQRQVFRLGGEGRRLATEGMEERTTQRPQIAFFQGEIVKM